MSGLALVDTSRNELLDYLAAQLEHFFPDRFRGDVRPTLARHIDDALGRLRVCINAVRMWPEDSFSYLHSEQNTTFLYLLANTIWRAGGDTRVCTKLFYMNKALNGFSCFYDNELPQRFLIGHSLGIVLVRAKYPEHFVVYQGCTVGREGDGVPELGEGTVMYPGSAIIGRCRVGARTVLSQGCSLVNADTPGDCLVFSGEGGRPAIKPSRRDPVEQFFRT